MTKHIKSKCLNLSSKKVAVIIVCILSTTQPVILTSLVILIKLNLIALLPNLLLFFCVQQTKHDPLASDTPNHCLKHLNFCCQLFSIKDFVLMELNQKLLTWVKTCHL